MKRKLADRWEKGRDSFLSLCGVYPPDTLPPAPPPPIPTGTVLVGGKHYSELWSCTTGCFRECCKNTTSCLVAKWDQGGDRETAGGREEASGPSCLLVTLDERKRDDRATCHGF